MPQHLFRMRMLREARRPPTPDLSLVGGEADVVGYLVQATAGGGPVFACAEHTPDELRLLHREVMREEAHLADARCRDCGAALAEVRAAPVDA